MNFSNQFADLWCSRFLGVAHCPQLNCLKADQFSSLLEQKQALEFEESKRCAIIDELKQQLNQENFIVDFLNKCIQKLSAVSQVFNEIDQNDSKSSSSSGTSSRLPPSCVSPPLSVNGSASHCNKFLPSNSTFSLFPHCIASSLIQSASPLLAAAAAGPSSPFLLPSTLPQFPGTDSIKLDPDSEPSHGRPSNFLLSAASDRSSYDALSRLTCSSSLYNSNNPFCNGSGFSAQSMRTQNSSFENRSRDDGQFSAEYNGLTSSSDAHAQAAAAVAAAFGLGFPSVRSRTTPTNHLSAFQKSDSLSSDSFRGSSSLHHSPPNVMNGKDTVVVDSSVERPYQCNTCSRSFAVKAGLVQHMRTHTDERPYPCLHCGRAFKQKIQLTTHMRVHSGERPYGCRLCGKLFRQQSHVVQHLRTHTGEKPHKCYQCGKAFRQKYSLISHQRRMCRNRAASNPIAAGMTMWISPGAGGDTCNLVKEFSPARSTGTTAVASVPSPSRSASTPVSVANSAHSPFSPCFAASPGNAISVCQTRHFQDSSNHVEDARFTTVQHSHRPCNSGSSDVASVSRISNYHHKPDTQDLSPKRTTGSTHLESDMEEDDEEDGYEDDVEEIQTNICSSRSTRLPTPQNTTPLGLT